MPELAPSPQFKEDSVKAIYQPILRQALLQESPELLDWLHERFVDVLGRSLEKTLTPEQLEVAPSHLTSLKDLLDFLGDDENEESSRAFAIAVLALRQWLFHQQLDPSLQDRDLTDFAFLWLDAHEVAAFASILMKTLSGEDPSLGTEIAQLTPDQKAKLLTDVGKRFQAALLSVAEEELGKETFEKAILDGAQGLFEAIQAKQNPMAFVLHVKEEFARAHIVEVHKRRQNADNN